MISLQGYVDQVLDDKYRLERLLGQGGMGAVYLATHLGTERYVALKLITPQFMRNEEFVERFKREARAAGRLRHPNVVDVTDFGFAEANGETVAYLVMEYLDGCTLGDVLSEERRLPLEWVVDILEQVCSAVHEAHQQGIVHRDLKPENIWLEPNRLGGYRVKVLDFGIAKLGEVNQPANDVRSIGERALPPAAATYNSSSSETATTLRSGAATSALASAPTNLKPGAENASGNLETDTLLYSKPQVENSGKQKSFAARPLPTKEVQTQLFNPPAQTIGGQAAVSATVRADIPGETQSNIPQHASVDIDDADGTLLLDQSTRSPAGSVRTTAPAATHRGTELTQIGAIMGTPPYMSPEQCAGRKLDARSDLYSLGVIAYQMLAGEPPFTGNTNQVMRAHIEAPPQPLHERRKVPKRVANLVMSALAKDPAARPPTASAFANSLRAQADGVGALYRRAFALYSEYFPKFFKLSLLAHIPVIITTVLLIVVQLLEKAQPKALTFTRISLIVCVALAALLQIVFHFLAASAISGMTAVIVTQLSAAPLRPVELRTALAVLKKRWKPFLKTSVGVTLRIILGYILLFIPGLIMTVRYSLYAPVVLMEGLEKKAARRRARELAARSWRTVIVVTLLQFLIPFTVSALLGWVGVTGNSSSGFHVAKASTGRQIFQELSGLINIIVVPLVSIVSALLYLKMRQMGGETLGAALAQIEEMDAKGSQWQQRMRTRLSLPPRTR
ncbi:MAG: serine/threonine-protein kinase [Pyrinomonadaceae bacterium]